MDGPAVEHTCSDGPPGLHGQATPTRKNKRKMKEPRKRKDSVSVVKRPCLDSSASDSDPDESTTESGGQPREFPPETPDSTPSPCGSGGSTVDSRYPLTVPNVYSRFSSTFQVETPDSETGGLDQSASSAEWTMSARKQRKNYKNMTRERRVEANARERTRVHAISAAFEGLRRAVPSYSYNQRLSKLAILRIACRYVTDCFIGSAMRRFHVAISLIGCSSFANMSHIL